MSRRTIALGGVLSLALALRVWGIGFGLPYEYNVDESSIIRRALAFGLGDLNPHSFHWPAFHLYVLFFLDGVVYLIGAACGAFGSADDYARLYFRDPTLFYLSGRALSALAGTATVYFTYHAGRLLDTPRTGLFAALCLALTGYHVRDSHLATLDVPATFWLTLSFLVAVRIFRAEAPNRSLYTLAGALAGLATATKYNAGIVLVAISAAHALHRPRPPLRLLVLALAAAVVAFAVATPFNLIDWPTFARDFRFQSRHLAEGPWGLGEDSALGYYGLRMLFVQPRSSGIALFDPMVLLFAIGAINMLCSRERRIAALVLVVPLAYLCYIGRWGMAATRYLNPIFPMLAIATGWWLARRSWAGLVAGGLALGFSLWAAVISDVVLARTDTRTEAKEWIEGTIAPETRIAVESYTPPLSPSARSLDERIRQLQSGELHHQTQNLAELRRYYEWLKQSSRARSYDLVHLNDSLLDPEAAENNRMPETNYDLNRLRELGVRYVVVSSFLYDRYRDEHARALYPALVEFYDRLERETPLVREFRPAFGQPGPTIRLYSLERRS